MARNSPPADVLARWLDWQPDAALVVAGRGSALMAVSREERAGRIVGGAVDDDLARQALRDGQPRTVRYGEVEAVILRQPDADVLGACHERLSQRYPAYLHLTADGRLVADPAAVDRTIRLLPAMRLKIVGEAVALRNLAKASGIEVVAEGEAVDPWTAVLMATDSDLAPSNAFHVALVDDPARALDTVEAAWAERVEAPFHSTGLVLLAAGQARRFGGDKLMADFLDGHVIDRSAAALRDQRVPARIAVVGPGDEARAAALRAAGWAVTVCEDAASGQAASLAAGLRAAAADPAVTAALVLLGDMPNVPDAHLFDLRDALTATGHAAFSAKGETLQPPAIFPLRHFDRLMQLQGDAGARQALRDLGEITSVPIQPQHAVDVDTRADLEAIRAAALLRGYS